MMDLICKTICKVIGHSFVSDPEICDRCGITLYESRLIERQKERAKQIDEASG